MLVLTLLEAIDRTAGRNIFDGAVSLHQRIYLTCFLQEIISVAPTEDVLETDTFTAEFATLLVLDIVEGDTAKSSQLGAGAYAVDILKSHIGMTGLEVGFGAQKAMYFAALLKPGQWSVPKRSLSMVLGTPITRHS